MGRFQSRTPLDSSQIVSLEVGFVSLRKVGACSKNLGLTYVLLCSFEFALSGFISVGASEEVFARLCLGVQGAVRSGKKPADLMVLLKHYSKRETDTDNPESCCVTELSQLGLSESLTCLGYPILSPWLNAGGRKPGSAREGWVKNAYSSSKQAAGPSCGPLNACAFGGTFTHLSAI